MRVKFKKIKTKHILDPQVCRTRDPQPLDHLTSPNIRDFAYTWPTYVQHLVTPEFNA